MAYYPKTRCVFKINGALRQIFSVKELKNGDLIITLASAQYHEHEGRLVPKSVERISVHRSLSSSDGGYTIKTLTETSELLPNDVRNYLIPSPEGTCSLIHSRACPDLAPIRYATKIRPKDRVMQAHPSDVAGRTIIYHIIVSDYRLGLDVLMPIGMNISEMDFGHFFVYALTGFLMTPPISEGVSYVPMTSIKGEFTGGEAKKFSDHLTGYKLETASQGRLDLSVSLANIFLIEDLKFRHIRLVQSFSDKFERDQGESHVRELLSHGVFRDPLW